MAGRQTTALALLAAILSLGMTWPAESNQLDLRIGMGATFGAKIEPARAVGPGWDYNLGTFKIQDALLAYGGIEWYPAGFLSLRLDAHYGSENLKQREDIKGWSGQALVVSMPVVLHSPAWHGMHAYAGAGPSLTLSRLCDTFGCTESQDWGYTALAGIQSKLTERVSWFGEYRIKRDYLGATDPEGCWQGEREVEAVLFGLTWTWR